MTEIIQPKATTEATQNHKGKMTLYPQTTRQFELIRQSITRCRSDFPDCYHHKHQQAKEFENLANSLRSGKTLLDTLTADKTLTKQEKAQLKRFNKATTYLIKHLDEIVAFTAETAQTPKEQGNDN